ncbi:hypothetical protein ACFRAO_20050 [Streptomyces sp. NPDC056656]
MEIIGLNQPSAQIHEKLTGELTALVAAASWDLRAAVRCPNGTA